MPKIDAEGNITEVDLPLGPSNTNFGQYFKLAAKDISSATFKADSFDSCVVEIAKDDKENFVQGLYNLMVESDSRSRVRNYDL
jgi:hypothetical protein